LSSTPTADYPPTSFAIAFAIPSRRGVLPYGITISTHGVPDRGRKDWAEPIDMAA